MKENLRIILAGGGTGGPVTPLLAVAEQIKKINPNTEFLFIGTKRGPEQELVKAVNFKFVSVPAAKLRRYISIKNILDSPKLFLGFTKSLFLIRKFNPDVIFSVGGFVAVPVSWAGRILGKKIVIHQQDARPGLANKLISPFASIITTAFEQTAKSFYSGSGLVANEKPKRKVIWTGNPVREEFFDSSIPFNDFFGLHGELPILLIVGGATGAQQINDVVLHALPELLRSHQVIHITGRGKKNKINDPNYHQYELLTKEMSSALKLADIVVSRAGLSTIAELSALGKVSIIVPMPNSHQEDNAAILKSTVSAVVLHKDEFDPETLARVVTSLKFNVERQKLLKKNIVKLMPKDSAQRIAQLIIDLINAKN